MVKLILNSASDDIEQHDKLRSVLKDLREARQAKTREGLRTIDHNALSVRLLICVRERNG